MHYRIFYLFLLSHVIPPIRGEDYCKYSSSHILCGKPTFSPRCGENLSLDTKVPPENQTRIVRAFNNYRNKAAGGRVKVIDGFLPPAANIVELLWDDELGAIAAAYAKQCLFEHSCEECRQVGRFGCGESLFLGTSSGTSMMRFTWEEIIYEWTVHEEQFLFVEDAQFLQRINQGGFSNLDWGHLIQAIWAETRYVGCGKMLYRPSPGSDLNLLAVCTFGPYGVVEFEKTYEPGNPCTQCPGDGKCSHTYPNLCSPSKGTYKDKPIPGSSTAGCSQVSTLLTPLSTLLVLLFELTK